MGNLSYLKVWVGHFGKRQGARREHSLSYATNEQRSILPKGTAINQSYLGSSVLNRGTQDTERKDHRRKRTHTARSKGPKERENKRKERNRERKSVETRATN